MSTLSFATNFDIGDGPSIIEENGQSYVMLVATSPTTGLILHRPERPYNDDDSCRILLAATPGYQSRVSLNTFPLPKNQHTLTYIKQFHNDHWASKYIPYTSPCSGHLGKDTLLTDIHFQAAANSTNRHG